MQLQAREVKCGQWVWLKAKWVLSIADSPASWTHPIKSREGRECENSTCKGQLWVGSRWCGAWLVMTYCLHGGYDISNDCCVCNKIDARKATRQQGRQMALATLCGALCRVAVWAAPLPAITCHNDAGRRHATNREILLTHADRLLPHATCKHTMRITMPEIGTTQPQDILEKSKLDDCVCVSVCVSPLSLPLSLRSLTWRTIRADVCDESTKRSSCSRCSSHCSSGYVAGSILFAIPPSPLATPLFLILPAFLPPPAAFEALFICIKLSKRGRVFSQAEEEEHVSRAHYALLLGAARR